jgi:hypothetical protein
VRNPLYTIYRWLLFKGGDLRWLGWRGFPFVATWDPHRPEVTGYELAQALRVAVPGDIVLLRHEGFLSNLGIGGAMVHAALCIGDDEVVEAVSDDEGGVVKRHLLDCLHDADKAMLIRPDLSFDAVARAIEIARKLVGFHYDVFFDFWRCDFFANVVIQNPQNAKDIVRFCCTAIPYFCYRDERAHLGLYRERNQTWTTWLLSLLGLRVGDKVVRADAYITTNSEIVWASAGATSKWFEQRGAEERVYVTVDMAHGKEATNSCTGKQRLYGEPSVNAGRRTR